MLKLLDSHLFQAEAHDSLRHLINYIARAAKYINYSLQMGDLGGAGSQNSFGEDQLELDVMADKTILNNLMICRLVSNVISEEQEKETSCQPKNDHGKSYSVCYDPLDGSSLVDTNLAIGSIFGIYESGGFEGKTGRDQVAALYVVYGPRTTLTYTIGKGVHEFVLNDVGEFTLATENLKVSEKATHFAPGNLRAVAQNEKYKSLMDHWMMEGYTLRYSGGMTPDINHILNKGQGIFTYPALPPKYPEGKLRLLFECNPMAFLVEQAGGAASDGEMDILDIKIEDPHQRTPIYIGSKEEVKRAVDMLK